MEEQRLNTKVKRTQRDYNLAFKLSVIKERELEKKVKQLEMEKEVLNRKIDIADDMLGTQIRKKYLPLLLEFSEQ